MTKESFSRKFFLVLVIMVIIDCVSGDTLDSLIKRMKKVKKKPHTPPQTVVKKEDSPEPIKTENIQIPETATEKEVSKTEKTVEENDGEIKYIPLVDVNGDDIKLEASEPIGKKEKVVKSKTKKVPKVVVKVKEVTEEVEVNKERIITEWMLFRSGVPLDYSYNEPILNPGDIVSAPGCPKSIDGYPWVLHEAPSSADPKCFLVGQHATVCQGSAVMHYQKGNEFGVCACNFQECLQKRGLPLNPSTSDLSNGNLLRRRNGVTGKLRYRFCRPLGVSCEEFVYDQKEKRCDIMYSQGPCKKKEWLQRNSKGGVECAERLCEAGSGLTEKSETFQRVHGNVTEENAECCRSWGGFSVASVLTPISKMSCEAGHLHSETLKKCLPLFKTSGLIVG